MNCEPCSVITRPTRTVAIGPWNGASVMLSAALAPVQAMTSLSFWVSWLRTMHWSWISSMKPSGKSGRIGRSIMRMVRTSFSLGAASRFLKPPGYLPAAEVRSR